MRTETAPNLTLALLRLAQDRGIRNDPDTRATLASLIPGLPTKRTIARTLCRLVARHLLVLAEKRNQAAGDHCLYMLTAAGRQYLLTPTRNAPTGPGNGRRGRSQPPASGTVQRATWRRAPMVGSPIAEPVPVPVRCVQLGVSSGIDARYQLTEAERAALRSTGELSRLKPGQYATEAQTCAARAAQRMTA